MSRSERVAFGFVSLLLAVLLPTLVAAQVPDPPQPADGEEQARAHFRLGRAYYDNGDFARAASEFEDAYRISERSALLYNLYLAYRDASDLPHAARALREYLRLEANVENRAQLSARLAALERSLAEPTVTLPAAAPAPSALTPPDASAEVMDHPAPVVPARAILPPTAAATVSVTHAASAHRSQETSSSSQVWPIALLAGGGALILGSVATGVLALGQKQKLANAQTSCRNLGSCDALSVERVNQLDDTRSTGRTFAVVTDVLLFGGIAAAVTGAALLLFMPKERRRDHASKPRIATAMSCSPGQCGGQLEVRFF